MNVLRALSLVASAAVLTGTPATLGGDTSVIPPAPAEVHARLASKQPLAKAIEAAEKDAGGLAREAAMDARGIVNVHVYSPAGHFLVHVDGASGAVKSKESCP